MAFCQPPISPGRQQQAVVGRDPLHLLGGIDQQAQVHSGYLNVLESGGADQQAQGGQVLVQVGLPNSGSKMARCATTHGNFCEAFEYSEFGSLQSL